MSIDGLISWPIRRVTDLGDQAAETGVVVEEPLEIVLDGRPVAVLMRTPGLEKELAVGYCLGEGLIARPSDIALVRHCGSAGTGELPYEGPANESRNRVEINLLPGHSPLPEPDAVVRLIRSGCGRVAGAALAEGLAPVRSDVHIRRGVLFHLGSQMALQQAAYRASGGIHAAAVFGPDGRAIIVSEDIGRHNAVDKATGYCLLRAIPLDDKILASTGRASYDMVAKAVRLGVPIVASLSSPTSLAVELAQALNCTLLGYVRGKRLSLYTHGWRITTE